MLILSREIGQSVIIADVTLTLVSVGERYVEIRLAKISGGKSILFTLLPQQYVDICYNVQVVFVAAKGAKARLGFECPPEVAINRAEFDSSSGTRE